MHSACHSPNIYHRCCRRWYAVIHVKWRILWKRTVRLNQNRKRWSRRKSIFHAVQPTTDSVDEKHAIIIRQFGCCMRQICVFFFGCWNAFLLPHPFGVAVSCVDSRKRNHREDRREMNANIKVNSRRWRHLMRFDKFHHVHSFSMAGHIFDQFHSVPSVPYSLLHHIQLQNDNLSYQIHSMFWSQIAVFLSPSLFASLQSFHLLDDSNG